MSEFRKGRLALALVVLAIAAIMLGAMVQTEDSQADDVQPRTDLTNLESITAVLNEGTALYNSNTYNDLKVGNSDDSEALITVMGQFNENGFMITRELEPGDYEFQGHSLSDRLDRGSYEITIVAGTKTAQLSVNVLEDVIQELSITENGRIYAGTSDDELREILVVTGVFEHIGVDNDPINYDVEWSKEAGQNVQFDFSATFNNRVVQQEAHFTVYEKKIESIKVESNGTLPEVFSGTDLNTLKDHFTVMKSTLMQTYGKGNEIDDNIAFWTDDTNSVRISYEESNAINGNDRSFCYMDYINIELGNKYEMDNVPDV